MRNAILFIVFFIGQIVYAQTADSLIVKNIDSINRLNDSLNISYERNKFLYKPPIDSIQNDSLLIEIIDSAAMRNKTIADISKNNSYWSKNNILTFDMSEVAFVNWNTGGTNSISGTLGGELLRIYKKGDIVWTNRMTGKFGMNKQAEIDVRKTEDLFEIVSAFGHRKKSNSDWYNSADFSFRTQFTNGYNYTGATSKILVSAFMAPGYLFVGGGTTYEKDPKKFSFYFSPLTFKETFVLDQELADKGSFGVKKAVYDTAGNRIKKGENFRTEIGMLIRSRHQVELYESIVMKNFLTLYTDYINNFGNIDVDWEVIFDFKVNKFFRATFTSHIKYDDDIKIYTEQADGSEVEGIAKVQWKQMLGLGVIYEF